MRPAFFREPLGEDFDSRRERHDGFPPGSFPELSGVKADPEDFPFPKGGEANLGRLRPEGRGQLCEDIVDLGRDPCA